MLLVFMLALRLATGTPSLPELISEWFTTLIPPQAVGFLIDILQTRAKPLLFLGMFLTILLLGIALGLGYGLLVRSRPGMAQRPWVSGSIFGLALWLLGGLVLSPLIDIGPLGQDARGGSITYSLVTLVYYAAFGLSLPLFYQWGLPRPIATAEIKSPSRRAFLKRMALVAVALAFAGYAGRLLYQGITSATPSKVFARKGEMPDPVTPTDKFYVVSKNIIDPDVKAEGWKLRVGGLVHNPYELTLEELRGLPAQEEYVTLTCISNPVGGDLISNALWKGVPLRDLLERGGMPPAIQKVKFQAHDGYSDSILLDRALNPQTMVAYEMNGEPLTRKHGFPARLLVPGLYGLKSVKWLSSIEPVDQPFQGYWQRRGWSDDAVIYTMSRVDVPADGSRLSIQELLVGGVAFAGERGIMDVEISYNDGRHWQKATLQETLAPVTWTLWTNQVPPGIEGRHHILVRATDGEGILQDIIERGSLPDGATGLHRITVEYVEDGAAPGAK